MEITVKNHKVSESQSQETQAYTADVYVDGVKAFFARNDGNGGADMFTPINAGGRDLLAAAEKWASSLPPYNLGEENFIDNNLELQIVEAVFLKKLNTRAVREYKKVQFITNGELRSITAAYREGQNLKAVDLFLKNKGVLDYIIVNGLAKDDAINVFIAYFNGEYSDEDRADKVAEILIDANIEPALVAKALNISLHDSGPR